MVLSKITRLSLSLTQGADFEHRAAGKSACLQQVHQAFHPAGQFLPFPFGQLTQRVAKRVLKWEGSPGNQPLSSLRRYDGDLSAILGIPLTADQALGLQPVQHSHKGTGTEMHPLGNVEGLDGALLNGRPSGT